MGNTNKEKEIARSIIKKYMYPLIVRAAAKGYKISHTEFTCEIDGKAFRYSYVSGHLHINTAGKTLEQAHNSPELFKHVKFVLADLEEKINNAPVLSHVAYFSRDSIERLRTLILRDSKFSVLPVYYYANIHHSHELKKTFYEVNLDKTGIYKNKRYTYGGRINIDNFDKVTNDAISFHEKIAGPLSEGNTWAVIPDPEETRHWLDTCQQLVFLRENELLSKLGSINLIKAMKEEGLKCLKEGIEICGKKYGALSRLDRAEQYDIFYNGSSNMKSMPFQHLSEDSGITIDWMLKETGKLNGWEDMYTAFERGLFSKTIGVSLPFSMASLKIDFPISPDASSNSNTVVSISPNRAYCNSDGLDFLLFPVLHMSCMNPSDQDQAEVEKLARDTGKGLAECVLSQLNHMLKDCNNKTLSKMKKAPNKEKESLMSLIKETSDYDMNRSIRKVINELASSMEKLDDILKDTDKDNIVYMDDVINIAGTGWVFKKTSPHTCNHGSLSYYDKKSRRYTILDVANAKTAASLIKKINLPALKAAAINIGELGFLEIMCHPERFCLGLKDAFEKYGAMKLKEIEEKKDEYYKIFESEYPEDLFEMWVMRRP